jgi:hypothetical protein
MVWAFLFKDLERAKIANAQAKDDDYIIVEDDFGQFARIQTKQIHGTLLEDLEQSEEARILRSLAEARTRVKLEARAKTDATIRQAMNAQGPGVLSPMSSRFS